MAIWMWIWEERRREKKFFVYRHNKSRSERCASDVGGGRRRQQQRIRVSVTWYVSVSKKANENVFFFFSGVARCRESVGLLIFKRRQEGSERFCDYEILDGENFCLSDVADASFSWIASQPTLSTGWSGKLRALSDNRKLLEWEADSFGERLWIASLDFLMIVLALLKWCDTSTEFHRFLKLPNIHSPTHRSRALFPSLPPPTSPLNSTWELEVVFAFIGSHQKHQPTPLTPSPSFSHHFRTRTTQFSHESGGKSFQ